MGSKWTVLIVEDDAQTGRRMTEALGDEFASRIAFNGQEAILFTGKRPPELVVIDPELPAVDGIEVSRFFKHKFGQWAVPILIVTEQGDAETRRACASVGCDDFLIDPWEVAELSASTDALIHLGRAERELAELEKRRAAAKKGLPPHEDNAEALIATICELRSDLAGRLIARGFAELAHGHVRRVAELNPDYAALSRLRAELS